MARMTGVVYITLNGQKKRSEGDASLKVGGKIREQIKDANGPCGLATKEVVGGEVKFTLRHGSDEDVVALQQLDDVTVLFETDSGQRYLVASAGTVGEVELKGNKVEVTMAGNPAELV
ncbi:phage tail tube protein [Chromobacterium phragmitis]|uniref:Phage tail tube protein n=1 Tax=Chromobacterium phragmitis TaxID=2202141 RepID=A0ABV0IVK9_9NEIS